MSTHARPAAWQLAVAPGDTHHAVARVAAVSLVTAALLWLFDPAAHLGYDALSMLNFGAALADLNLADFRDEFGSTAHPLTILVAAVLDRALGSGADAGLLVLVHVALGVSVACAYEVAARLWSPPAGAAAALAMLTSGPLLMRTAEGYQDIFALALLLAATAVFVARPRSVAVVVLATAATLVHPHAFVFAAAAAVWQARLRSGHARLVPLAIAAAGPLGWLAQEAVRDGGGPLETVRFNAQLAGRQTGLDQVPDAFWHSASGTVGAGVAIAGLVGLALALRSGGKPRALGAACLAGIAAFAVLGAAELPLNDRYAFFPFVLLAIFYGSLLASPRRAVVLGAALAGLASLPLQITELIDMRERLQARDEVLADLRAVLDDPAARAATAACPIVVEQLWAVPLVAREVDRRPRNVIRVSTAARTAPPSRALFIAQRSGGPLRVDIAARLRTLGAAFSAAEPVSARLAGTHEIAAEGAWAIRAAGCGSP